MISTNKFCFVLMPFGKKTDENGRIIDFDAIYSEVINPAITEADLEPIRADEEQVGGIIHKPMFERLVLCGYAIADLTTANANVFYELGVRHAARPWTTVLLFADGGRLPFDVAPLRALPYKLSDAGAILNVDEVKNIIVQRLNEGKNHGVDSPLYQLLEDYPNVQHEKTDVFRQHVEYSVKKKEEIAQARQEKNPLALQTIEQNLGELQDHETGVLLDIFLSYRAIKAWTEMIRFAERLPEPLRSTVMIREQYAFALNRQAGVHYEQQETTTWESLSMKATSVLEKLIEERGPSSETLGILGRVYKDRWENALKAKNTALAQGALKKAIDTYLKGFESDWRDAYPGINALTLMEIQNPPDKRRKELAPIVLYAVQRRIASGKPDYWDYATLLEASVLANDKDTAQAALADALFVVREEWERETTARNLRLIREAREGRGEESGWIREIEKGLVANT